MKYRINSVKREHSTIKGIIPVLEKITKIPEVKAITPGRIKPISGNYPVPVLQFKVKTNAGFKCIAKSQRSVQEVFIITDKTDSVIQILKDCEILS